MTLFAIHGVTITSFCWRQLPPPCRRYTCCSSVTSQTCVCLLTVACGIIRQSKNTVCEYYIGIRIFRFLHFSFAFCWNVAECYDNDVNDVTAPYVQIYLPFSTYDHFLLACITPKLNDMTRLVSHPICNPRRICYLLAKGTWNQPTLINVL